jgi:acetyltransferase EpsM
MKKVIIIGTGGNCVDILDTLNELNLCSGTRAYECEGFLDDDRSKMDSRFLGVPVIGELRDAWRYADCVFINGIGSSSNFWMRREILERTGIPRERFETIAHPTASISRTAELGRGTVVFQNVTITSRVRIGDHVLILPNTVVSHDDTIGDYTCIAGGVCISGLVTIGHSCYLGSNSTIMERTTIGDFCLVGMGSVVRHAVDQNSVVVGNPARFLRKTRGNGT